MIYGYSIGMYDDGKYDKLVPIQTCSDSDVLTFWVWMPQNPGSVNEASGCQLPHWVGIDWPV